MFQNGATEILRGIPYTWGVGGGGSGRYFADRQVPCLKSPCFKKRFIFLFIFLLEKQKCRASTGEWMASASLRRALRCGTATSAASAQLTVFVLSRNSVVLL